MNAFLSLLCLLLFLGGCNLSDRIPPKNGKELKNFYITRGKNYANTQNIAQAVMTFREAIKYYPDDPESYFFTGDLFMELKDYATARDYFAEVIRLQPDNAHAYLRMAACYDLQKDRNKAIQFVRKSAEIFRQKNDEVNFKISWQILERLLILRLRQ